MAQQLLFLLMTSVTVHAPLGVAGGTMLLDASSLLDETGTEQLKHLTTVLLNHNRAEMTARMQKNDDEVASDLRQLNDERELLPRVPMFSKHKGRPEKPARSAAKSFPKHWGAPPRQQTKDLRPLPGGYGRGSSTLSAWIKQKLREDERVKGGEDL